MPILPDNSSCCGCAACVDICPKNAISVIEDKNGYYSIYIDNKVCIDCKLCEKRCHILQQKSLLRNDPLKANSYAGWSKDNEIIKHAATGGVFTEIAKDFLSRTEAAVYGAELQADSTVKHVRISTITDLKRLQNSKYQQSYTAGIYKSVRKDLESGLYVLFSGVPCQIAALYIFLNYNEKLIKKLYTIEVLCHGVPSNILHRFAIKENKAKALFAYRNKDNFGWLRNNKVSYLMPDGSLKICKDRRSDFLYRSYLSLSLSRNSCNSCKYADINRVSDITIFDFWGLEKNERKNELINPMGTSVILANSEKGKELVIGATNMYLTPIHWHEFLPYNQNLFMPTNKYLFKGANHIHWIIKMPRPIQKFIYQNGFTNPLADRIYQKLYKIVFRRLIHKKIQEIRIESDKILKKLEE